MIKPKQGLCTGCNKDRQIVWKGGRLDERQTLCRTCNERRKVK